AISLIWGIKDKNGVVSIMDGTSSSVSIPVGGGQMTIDITGIIQNLYDAYNDDFVSAFLIMAPPSEGGHPIVTMSTATLYDYCDGSYYWESEGYPAPAGNKYALGIAYLPSCTTYRITDTG